MRAPKRSRAQQLADREKVAQLYVQGVPQYQIAEKLALTKGQVEYDILQIEAAWKAAAVDTIETERHWQLRRLNNIEREMWTAWEKSKTKRRTKKQFRAKVGEQGGATPEVSGGETVDETTPGDPRFIAVIMDCVKERSRLLGLYGATKIDAEVSGPGGEPLRGPELELTEEQLLEIVRLSYGNPVASTPSPAPVPADAGGGPAEAGGPGQGEPAAIR